MFKSKYGKKGIKKSKSTLSIRYRQEITGVLVAALLVFLAFSFFSYNPTDRSWFYFSSKSSPISNWCGSLGAHIAALFFFLLGGASYILLISLFIMVLLLFKDIPTEELSLRLLKLRLSMLPILVFSGSTLLNIYNFDFVSVSPGGAVGQILKNIFLPFLGKIGTLLMFYVVSWISIMVILQISFVRFLSVIGETVLKVFKGVFSFVTGLFANLFARVNLRRRVKKDEPEMIIGARPLGDTRSKRDILLNKKVIEKASLRKAVKNRSNNGPSIHYDLPDFSQFKEEKQEFQNLEEFESKCRERGKKLEEKLVHFGVKGKVVAIRPGPVITLFEYKPEIDSKISKIMSLEDDLAMALTALSIRILAPIPGRNVVGFEISNQYRQDVYLDDVLEGANLTKSALPFALGVDIIGGPVIQDLIKMPHMLVAGSTGSGKSVGLNAMLVSLLCKKRPDELKVILIDPKRLEFAPYADIPHLLFPIVTNPRKAVPVLKWVVQEMEDRYDIMAQVGARNIVDYNSGRDKMPFIVIIIDELADLMMVAGKDVETYIARTAQMARAAGIHMIVATQRPSVDVLTGMIKVNFPARIAFRVSSKVDSRTIIDSSGAEKLLGRGDMLFLDSGSSNPVRIHGAYVSTSQITSLADFLRSQKKVEYLDINEELRKVSESSTDDFEDELYDDVIGFLKSIDEVSISLLQRRYRIGFNRSARLIEKLERDGVVAPQHGSKMRKVVR